MWKKISSKVLLEHPRLTVVEDTVLLPNGTKVDYLLTPSNGSGAIIIAERKGKILLQKEYSYPPNEVIFQFPGGFVPTNEKLEIGANRELMEESGLKANKLTFLGKYLLNNRRSNAYMHVFLATDLIEKHLKGDAEEKIESFWFSEKEINDLIKNGEIKNTHLLAAWSLYMFAR